MGRDERLNAIRLVEELKKKKATLTREVELLKIKHDFLDRRVNSLSVDKSRVAKEVKKLSSQNKGWKKKNSTLIKENKKSVTLITEKKKELSELSKCVVAEGSELKRIRVRNEKELKSIEKDRLAVVSYDRNVKTRDKAINDKIFEHKKALIQFGIDTALLAEDMVAVKDMRVKANSVEKALKAAARVVKSESDRVEKVRRKVEQDTGLFKKVVSDAKVEIKELTKKHKVVKKDIKKLSGIQQDIKEREKKCLDDINHAKSVIKSADNTKKIVNGKRLQMMKILKERGLDDIVEQFKELR